MNDRLDQEHEAAGGVFHACTVRRSNGYEPDLPSTSRFGCRITRVPLQAHMVAVGDVIGQEEDGEDVRCEEAFYHVVYGNVGVGFMAPVQISTEVCDSAEAAVEMCRDALLKRGDCFRTRAEAIAAVTQMLNDRHNAI